MEERSSLTVGASAPEGTEGGADLKFVGFTAPEPEPTPLVIACALSLSGVELPQPGVVPVDLRGLPERVQGGDRAAMMSFALLVLPERPQLLPPRGLLDAVIVTL